VRERVSAKPPTVIVSIPVAPRLDPVVVSHLALQAGELGKDLIKRTFNVAEALVASTTAPCLPANFRDT
jgi:hypothetical protein